MFALAQEGLLPRLFSRFDETRKVPTAATLCISAATIICLLGIAGAHSNPYAAIIPVLIGTGTLGIIGLQAAASIAILVYVARRRREAGWVVLAASLCAAAGLVVALGTVCFNFTLLSAVQTPFVAWLPLLYPAILAAGFCFSLWLRRARPAQYAGLALVEHRLPAFLHAAETPQPLQTGEA